MKFGQSGARETAIPLVSLNVPISNGALSGEKLPDRLKILGWGNSKTAKGDVTLSDFSASAIGSQGSFGFGEIALDFEHNTVPGSPEYERTQEPRSVAGYGRPEVVKGDGLYLTGIRWTPEGEKAAKNFADLSPAVQLDKRGQVVFVHSAALTRNGAVEGLHFFSASGRPGEETKTMAIEIADLAPILGLNADASKEVVLSKLKERLTVEHKPITAFSVMIDGKESQFGAPEILALSAKVSELETKAKKIEDEREASERVAVINAFSAEGKVPLGEDKKPIALDTLKTFSVGELKRLLANTPKTVVLSAGHKSGDPAAPELKGLDKAIQAHKQNSK